MFESTSRYAEIENATAQDLIPVLSIDPQGAMQVKAKRKGGVYIFIVPPSMQELERRVKKRGTESPESIDTRLRNARDEVEYISEYDYLIVNDNLGKAIDDLRTVIRATQLHLQVKYFNENDF